MDMSDSDGPSPAAGASAVRMPGNAPAVKLLWTGGWDSTFQLLRLLLEFQRPVVPFYLADDTRASTRVEIDTMARIRERLALDYPHTRELLSATQIFHVSDLQADADVESAFDQAVQRRFMGNQYAWLARFCRQQKIDDIELSIHLDDNAHAVLARMVVPTQSSDGYPSFRLSDDCRNSEEYQLFHYFSFPLFNTSKLEMARIASERGWNDIMHMTWFCHRPTRDQQPCGHCNPCLYTIQEGLGWRIPVGRRMLAVPYRLFVRPLKAQAKAFRRHLQARGVS
jgi:7-cyano-7-deazaguanine synthase in queuosine biosynthesis